MESVELFKSEDFKSGRIPKKIKPDFESITKIFVNGNNHILLLGSGSTENRDNGFLVKLPNRYNKKHFITPVSLKGLYDLMRSNEEIVGDGKLNIEAAASNSDHFILFNRSNKSGNNILMDFNLEEFLVFLNENHELIPFPAIHPFTLPSIEGIPAGFSGASIYEDKLFFTASVEDTSDAVLDGKVHGSFTGYFNLRASDYLRGNERSEFSVITDKALIEEDGKIFPGKVESISIFEKDSETKYIALAITDNDQGASELLMIEIDL
jgi:hypothetical protein